MTDILTDVLSLRNFSFDVTQKVCCLDHARMHSSVSSAGYSVKYDMHFLLIQNEDSITDCHDIIVNIPQC